MISVTRHAQERAWERFGYCLGPLTAARIAEQIYNGQAERVPSRDARIPTYRCTVMGADWFVVFDTVSATIVTVMRELYA